MLIVLFIVLFIAAIFAGAVEEEFGWVIFGIDFIVLIVLVGVWVSLLDCTRTVPNQIKVYEEENERIEEQINLAVTKYMEHEGEIFDKVSEKESAITLVSLYPELKSDKLVQAQIDVYVENNNEIKKLKAQKANESAYRFWLYFGR